MQGELFDDKDKRYEVFKLTPAQRRNGKRGVARCRKILDKATGATVRLQPKQKGE